METQIESESKWRHRFVREIVENTENSLTLPNPYEYTRTLII